MLQADLKTAGVTEYGQPTANGKRPELVHRLDRDTSGLLLVATTYARLRALSDAFAARGWKNAERAARLHVTSRLNALSLLPTAAKAGKLAEGGKKLLGHTFRKF